MAYEIPVFDHTFVAAGTIVQHTYVKLDSDGKIVPITANTDKPIGIAQDAGVSGDSINVRMLGISKLTGAEALAVGDAVGPSANGRGEVKVVGTDTTQYVGGTVLGAVANADEVATVTVDTLTLQRAV